MLIGTTPLLDRWLEHCRDAARYRWGLLGVQVRSPVVGSPNGKAQASTRIREPRRVKPATS